MVFGEPRESTRDVGSREGVLTVISHYHVNTKINCSAVTLYIILTGYIQILLSYYVRRYSNQYNSKDKVYKSGFRIASYKF